MSTVDPSGVQNDVLNTIFGSLRHKSEAVRKQAAEDLADHVARTVAEMSSEAVSKLWNDHINRRLFELIHSNNTHEQLGGITAIDSLLEVEGDETIEAKRNLFRLYNYVKYLLP
ncbi:phosphatidylinositol kinase- protein kinase tor1, partial [Tulasnella sp. 403]